KLLLTFWNWVWLKVLKLSKRICKPLVSPKAKVLKRERFQLSRPGPRRALWPRLPKVAADVTLVKAAGSMYWIFCGPTTCSSYLILPVKSGRLLFPTTLLAIGVVSLMLTGNPDEIEMIPETCQPPSVDFKIRLELLRSTGML